MSLIIAGTSSGVGKTTVTISLLASLCRRGVRVQPFKVGPDYIDPMFHEYVTGRPCRNLDPVLTSETYVQQCFANHLQGVDYGLVEGVMGLFDGVQGGGQDQQFPNHFASTAHIARLLNLPILLVIDCSRLSGSVAAIAHGYRTLDPRINIAGVVLNRVGSDRHLSLLENALSRMNLPILGVLRRQNNIQIPDRHLGLIPTDELPQLNTVIEQLADLGDSCFDWEKLLPLLRKEKDITNPQSKIQNPKSKIRIAIARDQAFNFYYQDNLDLLQQLGAELVYWSPLQDTELPANIQGMYFGGGFPEIFAPQLAANNNVREAIKTAILAGMPTIAECGGLMYLCQDIVDFEGKSWSMVGILPSTSRMEKHLTLGYRRAIALEDSPLVSVDTTIYGHEFHRSSLVSTTDKALLQTYRYDSEEIIGNEGWTNHLPIHASYIHLHWGARPEMPQRFLHYCRFIALRASNK
ncbi:MAG: cobyrinate a,c-diamide synthase [Calothrix sp. MO_192.B10]|nr:cobyrinate a,c-diamide synthase [Calothrix sp. MO_192.B10]